MAGCLKWKWSGLGYQLGDVEADFSGEQLSLEIQCFAAVRLLRL
jgi:hypothetical protein